VAAFKRGLLAGLGRPTDARIDLEARAYELTVDTGEAAIGRASFDAIRSGRTPAWGPRTLLDDE
jgi:enoyl-CoA hydratase/methylglutaconyl-CoA hydratase